MLVLDKLASVLVLEILKLIILAHAGRGEVVWGICARSRMQCFGIGIYIANIGIGEIDVIKLVKLVLVLVLEISNFLFWLCGGICARNAMLWFAPHLQYFPSWQPLANQNMFNIVFIVWTWIVLRLFAHNETMNFWHPSISVKIPYFASPFPPVLRYLNHHCF